MVSKIAVTAIVLVVAVPILLGYGMAFKEVTKSSWDPTGESVLITDVITNDMDYSYVTLDTYSANSALYIPGHFESGYGITPAYPNKTTAATLLGYSEVFNEVRDRTAGAGETINVSKTYTSYKWDIISATFDIDTPINATFTHLDETTTTINGITDLYSSGSNFIGYVGNAEFTQTNVTAFTLSSATTFTAYQKVTLLGTGASALYQYQYPNTAYGWTIPTNMIYGVPGNSANYAVLTIDFSDLEGTYTYSANTASGSSPIPLTITRHNSTGTDDPSYMEVNGEYMYLKTDPDGTISENGNVYQIVFNKKSYTVNYIGNMPTMGTEAYAYSSVNIPYGSGIDTELQSISISSGPVYRTDVYTVRSNNYPVISDGSYTFGTLSGKISSQLELSKPEITGTSITLAGETFNANGIYLKISGKSVSMDGLKIRSYFEDGVYHNSIGNHDLPDTNQPLEITFNGVWYLGVKETALEYNEWQSTEWQPGEFAWNGVDSSFALMGLITCAAAFVGLGMYGKRSGAKVGTLMLVCGCAAFVFLALL